ncbi:hypothetical protein GQR58_001487 [Nymphon striatum]|nr:hypothetical protein GQR58_001487 [Nymphon striatum]
MPHKSCGLSGKKPECICDLSCVVVYIFDDDVLIDSPLPEQKSEAVRLAELEIERLKIESETKVRLAELASKDKVEFSKPNKFDVSKHINMVPPFHENEYTILLQSVLKGKAIEIYTALSPEQTSDYHVVKESILHAYQLVPEAYQQKFRNYRKDNNKPHVEFAKDKARMFDRWCTSESVERNYEKIRQLILIEEFKNCVHPQIKTYIIEHKANNLDRASEMADEYTLSLINSLFSLTLQLIRVLQTLIPSGTISLLNNSHSKPIKILRDTGASQSLLLADTLSLSVDPLATDESVLIQNVEVGVVSSLPVNGIHLLLGNDLAGDKVIVNPIVTKVPVLEQMKDPIEKEIPNLYPACADISYKVSQEPKVLLSCLKSEMDITSNSHFCYELSDTLMGVSDSEIVKSLSSSNEHDDNFLKEVSQEPRVLLKDLKSKILPLLEENENLSQPNNSYSLTLSEEQFIFDQEHDPDILPLIIKSVPDDEKDTNPVSRKPLNSNIVRPFTVCRKLSYINDNYVSINTPGRRKSKQLCYINITSNSVGIISSVSPLTELNCDTCDNQPIYKIENLQNADILKNIDSKFRNKSSLIQRELYSTLLKCSALFLDIPTQTSEISCNRFLNIQEDSDIFKLIEVKLPFEEIIFSRTKISLCDSNLNYKDLLLLKYRGRNFHEIPSGPQDPLPKF